MNISKSNFIKCNAIYDKSKSLSPVFRRTFTLDEISGDEKLSVCTLGFGTIYINGKRIDNNLFCAPTSDFSKTLWYKTYDVSSLLRSGTNVIVVWCGNGWYNESVASTWKTSTASWRDAPKFTLSLYRGDEILLLSDTGFMCKNESAIIFNELRSGEYFDFNLYDEKIFSANFDDSDWGKAMIDTCPPEGVLRECLCEPISEFELFEGQLIKSFPDNRFIFDIGQNISGYIRIKIEQGLFGEIKIRYRESIDENCELFSNDMEKFYASHPFQTDKLILDGKEHIWSPQFTYHGFRYIEISGISDIEKISVKGVFVHQAVEKRSGFECSDSVLNKLFSMGQLASFSNMFYSLTDCPSREKLGWTNDAQASCEQLLTNFRIEKLLKKWLQDIYDAMRSDGALPGIIPTWGWGFDWGNGPVSDGVLFEIPYRLYLHTGDHSSLVESIPYFKRYLDYISTISVDGIIDKGLWDWSAPNNYTKEHIYKVPVDFINHIYIIKFLKILILALSFTDESTFSFNEQLQKEIEYIKANYINSDGSCKIEEMTALSLLIYHEVCTGEKLKEQLKKCVEKHNFHTDCGMVGNRHLYIALNKCGLSHYAYKIITAEGYPSYKHWLEDKATTLCELWENVASRNHHMFSDFMSWLMKTVIGINQTEPAFKSVEISPVFFEELDYAKGFQETASGTISVSWERTNEGIKLSCSIPEGIRAFYTDTLLKEGLNEFIIK